MKPDAHTADSHSREFVILMAVLMSVVAISIDAMLPALGAIGESFGVTNPNHTQYIIGFLFMGMACGQLVCGPISDALGRKPVLYFGMGLYLLGTIGCLTAHDFQIFLFGRFVQGIGIAAPYVSTMSIVRDRYSGRDMARVMSIIMMIFVMTPALAPSLGQAILLWASWKYIFWLYVAYACIVIVWMAFRLEETLPPEKRIPFHTKNIVDGFREVTRNRTTMCYMLCIGICFGSFIGYLNSSRQIFQVQFNSGNMFPIYFGCLALLFGAASLINSRVVEKLGMRYICTAALYAVIGGSVVFLGLHFVTEIRLWMFLAYAGILFFTIGLMFGNLNSIAMEPMEHVAGIASAVIGSVSSLISMTLGSLIGQLYNNTLIPMSLGFMGLGALSLLIMKYEARGKKLSEES